MAKRRKSTGWSAIQVTLGLTAVVFVLTWMVAASAYATARFQAEAVAAEEAEDERPAEYIPRVRLRRTSGLAFGVAMIAIFLKNAVVEIPRAPQVIWFAFTQRLLIPIGFVLTEGLVLAFGMGLKLTERSLESPMKKRRSTVAEIRVPKPGDD